MQPWFLPAPRRCARYNFGALACALLIVFWTIAPAYAASTTLPTGGAVASGNATISQSGNTLNINQSSNSAIINWQSFSVGRDSTVNFNQPGAASSTLNRVLGSTPSWIAGTINAPGTVLLVNPNGIVITKSGVVNTGSFAASSLDIKDSDYLSGHYSFTGNGGSAAVRNNGRINVSDGGFVALLGGQVANNGVISARLGKVAMGAGEMATLDLSGDGFLSVAVPSNELGKLVDAKGALVSNRGKIRADGGAVYLSAAAAANILRNAVNIPGSVRANSVGTHNGKIVINGGGGRVRIAGRVSTKGRHGNGGAIEVRGADIDVSGKLDASAHSAGATGGTISVIAADTASVSGLLLGEGGNGGRGGFIETSGEHLHVADSAFISTTAQNGVTGTWLIDPQDFIIAPAGGDITGAALSAQLATTNVSILSTNGATSGNGDIFVRDAVTWTSIHGLTLNAVRNINISSAISGINGSLTLTAAASGTISATAAVNVGSFLLTSGNWVQNTATMPAFSATSFTVGGGSFLRVTGGAGTSASPYQITDVYGLQGIGSSSTLLAASYVLANDIDASGTAHWNGGAGFNPIGSASAGFSGAFDGRGHLISNLLISRSSITEVGLFGVTSGGSSIANVGISGTITGLGNVGSLVGHNNGSISNSYSKAAVSANDEVGGLVGWNDTGTISNSYATGAVTLFGYDPMFAGGLVGANNGTIVNAYAIGAVTGYDFLGGLAGANQGVISNAYSTGAVIVARNADQDGRNIGGFTGYNSGTITGSAFDNQTSGRSAGVGFDFARNSVVQALSTSALQSTGLTAIFGSRVSTTVWGGGSGGLYPYLTSFFPSGVQAISGTAYKDAGVTVAGSGPNGVVTVNGLADGASLGSTTTGANGYYYLLVPGGTIAAGGTQVVAYTTGSTGGVVYQQNATGSLTGFNINGTYLTETTSGSTLSSLASGLAVAIGSSGVSTSFANQAINATGPIFSIDQALSGLTNLVITSSGFVSQSANIDAFNLKLLGSGGTYILNGLNNTVATLSANTGTVVFTDAEALNIGTATDPTGFTVSGSAALTSSGGFGQFQPIVAPALTLVTSGADAILTLSNNNVGDLAANLGAGLLAFDNAGALTIRRITANGGVVIRTITGDLTTAGPIVSNGLITLEADAGNVLLGGSVTSAASTVAIFGNAITQSATQTLQLGGSGTFTLSFGGRTTSPISVAASAAAIQAALNALSSISGRGGSVVVSVVNGAFAITFGGALAAAQLPITVTPGSGATATLSTASISGTSVGLNADQLTIAAPIIASDTIFLAPKTANLAITLGTTSTPTGLVIDNSALSFLSAPTLTVGNSISGGTRAGAFTLGTASVGSATLNLFGSGAVTQDNQSSGFTVNGGSGSLNVTAGGTVDLSRAPLSIGAIGGSTTGGDFLVFNTGPGALVVNAVTTAGGDILISNLLGALNVDAPLVSTGGNMLLGSYAAGLTLGATLSAGSGAIGLFATNADLLQANGFIDASKLQAQIVGTDAPGTLALTSAQNLVGAVNLAAANGDIYFTDNAALTVGGFSGIRYASLGGATWTPALGRGIRTGSASGLVSLLVGSNVTQGTAAGDIVSTGTLTVTRNFASPSVTLDNANNVIADLDVVSLGRGAFTLVDSRDLAITGSSAAGGGFTITTQGALTQNLGVSIDTSRQTSGLATDGVIAFTTTGGGAGGNGITLYGALNAGSGGAVMLHASGFVSQRAGAITAGSVDAIALAQDVALNAAGNAFSGISGAAGGNFSANSTQSLTAGSAGVNAGAAVTLTSAHDLTIAASATVQGGADSDVVLSALGNFINDRGSDAVAVSGAGRWLIYSAAPGGDVFGNLDSGNTAVWNATYASLPPAGVTAAGNRYLFAYRPTLTLSPSDAAKTYGDVATLTYSVSGLQAGVANAFLADTLATAMTGAPALTSSGAAAGAGVGLYAIDIAVGTAAGANGYALLLGGPAQLTVNARPITIAADAQSRVYGDANPALTYQLTSGSLVNGDTLAGALATAATQSSNVGAYAITQGTLGNSNYAITYVGANLTITPAALLFTANPASWSVDQPFPVLSGVVTGFKLGQSVQDFGGDVWTSTATSSSAPGAYPISGSLRNAAPNYAFVQAAANATALAVSAAHGGNGPSQEKPSSPGTSSPGVTITYQSQNSGPVAISFTPASVRTANTATSDVTTSALPDGAALACSNGHCYPPICQCDANQYSGFKLPDYAKEAGEAAVFTMIARGADAEHAADAMIDTFWNGKSGAWPAAGALVDKVAFSDGAGNTVVPNGNAGFAIAGGSTDFAALLARGPVMIAGGEPAHWLLATQLLPGKGIVANDPATGRQVLIAYDAATKTLGGVTAVFDASSKSFVPLAGASSNPELSALQSFAAARFLAVTVK